MHTVDRNFSNLTRVRLIRRVCLAAQLPEVERAVRRPICLGTAWADETVSFASMQIGTRLNSTTCSAHSSIEALP